MTEREGRLAELAEEIIDGFFGTSNPYTTNVIYINGADDGVLDPLISMMEGYLRQRGGEKVTVEKGEKGYNINVGGLLH